MRKKANEMVNEKIKRSLAPKLRFPEFKGEWTVEKLGELGRIIGGGTPDKSVSEYWEGNIPWVSSSDVHEDDIHTISISRFINKRSIAESATKIIPTGSVLFVSRVGVGKLAINNFELCTSQDFTNFIPEKISNYFVGYSFSSKKSALISLGQGTSIQGFSKNDLEEFELCFPNLVEQKKIVDCLSSIDDLITAQTQKLEALKSHKKGLMQQLFPAEGKTQPKLRFPKFRDSGEWEKKSLNRLGELVSGLTYSPDDVRDSGLLVLRSSNIQNGEITLDDNVYVTPSIKGANLTKVNDILICVRNGSKALIGKNAIIPEGMPLCTHGAFMTVFRTSSAKFVFQLFQSKAYQKQVDADLGATINSINGGQFLKYKFYVPSPKEQKKIADCLSSIDDLITAQTQKLNALRSHKKGLMQQLFPTTEETKK